MKVLVVGGGGREHALCWGLARSPLVEQLHAAPGNAGIASVATCHAAAADDVDAQLRLADELDADLVVIGPEAPLVAGLADELRARGRRAFGPGRAAARLEGSKAFAKDLMVRARIPTARAATFSAVRAPRTSAFVDELGGRAVVKADGLAAGKGVTVASDRDGAVAAIEECLVAGAFGEAGAQVVVEEVPRGARGLGLRAGRRTPRWCRSALAQDFKRAGDGDTGPNTGGMGAYSPLPWLDPATESRIWEVVASTVGALHDDGIAYSGLLYTGLMLTAGGPEGPRVQLPVRRPGDPGGDPAAARGPRRDAGRLCDGPARGPEGRPVGGRRGDRGARERWLPGAVRDRPADPRARGRRRLSRCRRVPFGDRRARR